MTKEQVIKCLTSTKLTVGERFVIEATQFNSSLSGFGLRLWELLCVADEFNLAKISRGFPEHVAAIYRLRNGELEKVCKEICSE